VMKPFAAATGAVIANFCPLLLWLSRETIIDYWLTSMVALAIWVLVGRNGLSNRRRALLFGFVCGLGMLTKWTFAFFVLPPALWFARNNLKNAAIAAAIATGLAAYWYVFAAHTLGSLLSTNLAQSINEGDPSRFSLGAVDFYIRALEGSQLF